MLWIRLGFKELKKNRGFALFFTLNLTLGLAGFIAIHSFGRSLNSHLDANLKEILTADMVISSNKALEPENLARIDRVLGPEKSQARLISFYTMVRAGSSTRLMRVMAIDDAYPLYGGFSLENDSTPDALQRNPDVFITRDSAYALGIREPNRPVTLGETVFNVRDFILSDPDRSLTALELAPKIYMGIDRLAGTGLIQFGSRVWYSRYYRFGPETDVPGLVQRLRSEFAAAYPDQQRVNIYDSRDVNQNLGRLTGYFTGYMGLVSVVTLFLAGIATAYLFRGYLDLKQQEIAVLMSIGARRREIWLYISFQLILLGALAAVLATLLSLVLVPAFPVIFQGLIPDQVSLRTDPVTVFLALGLGMAGSQIFCLPVFVQIFNIKPLMLLRKMPSVPRHRFQNRIRRTAGVFPGLIAFLLISVYAAGDLKTGIIFVSGFTVALTLLSVAGWILLSACNRLSNTRNPARKIAFRNLYRNKWASLSCFVTIAMGVFLISLIPQVQKGLQDEIVRPEGLKIPVFFLVDIQEEQKMAFIEFMNGNQGEIANLSPMVRGRIMTKNRQPFHDEPPRSGARPRGTGRRLEFNFSFRTDLDKSETIVRGQPLSEEPWDYTSQQPFEISVEASFAERYRIEMDDLLEFEIQGIPFTGRVKNFRKVRWNSFQPNFFLLFQNGVLNDAPKTYLSAVSGVPADKRQALKNKIADAFPNVSVIDVTRMAGTLLDITDKLSLSIRFMAWLAIAAGLISIFSIARHEARKNKNQINLLKVLGSGFPDIRAITLIEFGFIGFTASFFAVGLSYLFSWTASWYFFDNLWQIHPVLSVLILFFTTGICMGTALFASKKVMESKPITLLGNSHA
ncbi:MAG: FtsX-like permease family protein [Desulfobacterales bacterium]|nr:FtsX-like permease family protein [Desulfobacterales bacterium]